MGLCAYQQPKAHDPRERSCITSVWGSECFCQFLEDNYCKITKIYISNSLQFLAGRCTMAETHIHTCIVEISLEIHSRLLSADRLLALQMQFAL